MHAAPRTVLHLSILLAILGFHTYSFAQCCDPIDRDECINGDPPMLWHPATCTCTPFKSPIILDLSGNGYHLTDVGGGVFFQFGASESPTQVAWTAAGSDEGFLALDRNGNGMIDDATELFGNYTPQPASRHPTNEHAATKRVPIRRRDAENILL
jgi:hypothetical protein